MKKKIFIISIILLAAAVALYGHGKRTMIILSEDLNRQEEDIKKYKQEAELSPGSEAIAELKKESVQSEKELKKAKSVFDSKVTELPADVSDKGIYFFESLYATNKLLERKATAKRMVAPPVNFSVDIPEETDIPYLLKQIEMIEQVMSIVIDGGNCEIESIAPIPLDMENKVLDFIKISMQATMYIEANALVRALSEISSHIPLYIVEELSVKSVETNKLKVNFTVSRILTDASLDEIAEFTGRDIKNLNVIFPLDSDVKSFSTRNPFFRYKKFVKEERVPAAAQVVAIPAPVAVVKRGPQFTYKGIIDMNGNIVGIIKDNWKDDTCFSQSGDTCSGYKVISIEDKEVKLSKDEEEIILMKGAEDEGEEDEEK